MLRLRDRNMNRASYVICAGGRRLSVILWTIIVAVILTADGRWLAAGLGAMIGAERTPLRALRLVGGCAAAGPTQTCVAALGLWTGVFAPPIALALLIGAAWAAASENARRWAAKELEATEEELAELTDHDDQP